MGSKGEKRSLTFSFSVKGFNDLINETNALIYVGPSECDHFVKREISGDSVTIEDRRFNDVEDKWIVSLGGSDYSDDEILQAIHFQEQYYEGKLVR